MPKSKDFYGLPIREDNGVPMGEVWASDGKTIVRFTKVGGLSSDPIPMLPTEESVELLDFLRLCEQALYNRLVAPKLPDLIVRDIAAPPMCDPLCVDTRFGILHIPDCPKRTMK